MISDPSPTVAADPFAIEVMLRVFVGLATSPDTESRLRRGDDARSVYRELARRAQIAAQCFDQASPMHVA